MRAVQLRRRFSGGWGCTDYNVHGTSYTNKMVNWETKKDGYTREEMNAIIAENQ